MMPILSLAGCPVGAKYMKTIFLFCLTAIVPAHLRAQDTLSLHDSQEIQFLAKRKIEKGYADLLNTITFEDVGDFERQAIIAASYGNSLNKIFYDSLAVIEDDINPEHKTAGNTIDLAVGKYLRNFELFYPKSVSRTIQLADFTVSGVKKADYYYTKVYFTSRFTQKHTQSEIPYEQLNRVAELRAEKNGKKWQVYVSRIAFVPPGDSATSAFNDVVVDRTGSQTDEGTGVKISLDEQLREKERAEERAALATYNTYLSAGDEAFRNKDYVKALEAYTEAEKRNQFDDLLPRRKIYQVKQAFEKEKQTDSQLLNEYAAKATLAEKKRYYAEAIANFKKILALRPDSVAIQTSIKILNQKSSVKAELDEKYNSGKYAEVIRDYSKILKRDKGNPDFYLGRGMAYVKANESEKALKDFTRSIELDFSNLAAIRARSDLYAHINDFPKAIADLASYLNIDDADADIHFRRGGLRIATKNQKGALEDYGRAITLSSKVPVYWFGRGELNAKMEDYPAAISDFTSAIKLDATYQAAYYHRGLAQLKLGMADRASSDFRKLRQLGIKPEQEQNISLIAGHYFESGLKFLNAHQIKESVQQFDNVLLIKPEMADAWFFRCNALLIMGDTTAALTSVSNAISHRQAYHEAYFRRGQTLYNLKRYAEAAADFRSSADILPTNYLANIGEGNALFAQGLLEKAIVSYEFLKINERKIGKNIPDSVFAKVNNNLGLAYQRQNQSDKAIEEFNRALDRNKLYWDAYYNRGAVYLAAGSLRKAISDFKRAVELNPENPSFNLMLGKALEQDERFNDAIKSYAKAIEKDTANECCRATALIGSGFCNSRIGLFAKAAEYYEAAFRVAPGTATDQALLDVAYAHVQNDSPNQAIKHLYRISPGSALRGESFYAMGCAFLQMHHSEEALKWFEKSFRTGLISKSFIRKDRLLEKVDKSFMQQQKFKELVAQNVLR